MGTANAFTLVKCEINNIYKQYLFIKICINKRIDHEKPDPTVATKSAISLKCKLGKGFHVSLATSFWEFLFFVEI